MFIESDEEYSTALNELVILMREKVVLSGRIFALIQGIRDYENVLIELNNFKLNRHQESKKLICPRCKGAKSTTYYANDGLHYEPCKYCLGEGFIK